MHRMALQSNNLKETEAETKTYLCSSFQGGSGTPVNNLTSFKAYLLTMLKALCLISNDILLDDNQTTLIHA